VWLPALLLGLVFFGREVEQAIASPLQQFDEGIELSAVTFLAHGVVPIAQNYQPYGPALGLPGLPAYLLFHGHQLLGIRVSYAIAPALVVALFYLWAVRRLAWPFAVAAALVASNGHVVRYDLPWIAVLAFLIWTDAVVHRSSEGDLTSAIEQHPRALAAAGGVLGLAPWFRLEYVVFALVWGAILWGASRARRPPWLCAGVPLLVACAPLAVILVVGPDHTLLWARYALVGFRQYRSQPVDWDFPGRWVSHLLHGHNDGDSAGNMVSYLVGAAVVAVWLVNLALPARSKILKSDRTRLALFTVIVCGMVTYAQAVRFSSANGLAAVPLIWAAVVAVPFRSRWPVAITVIVGAAITASGWTDVVHAPSRARDAWRANGAREQVDKFERVPLQEFERPSIPAIAALWTRDTGGAKRTFVVSQRNDDAQANPAFLYWLLDAKPAAWATTYDPGLADRGDVQREEARALCRNRAPLVQLVGSYSRFGTPSYRSRYLDQFLALNYRVDAKTTMFRLLRAEPHGCLLPERASMAQIVGGRARLFEQGELPAAGALSTLVIERLMATHRNPTPLDAELAVLGGYYVPDAELPTGPVRVGLLSLRDQRPLPGLETAATDQRSDPMARLIAQTAFITLARPSAPAPQTQAVSQAALHLVVQRPHWRAAFENVAALVPATPPLASRLARAGVRGEALDGWRFNAFVSAQSLPGALSTARRLIPMLRNDPLTLGGVWIALSRLYAQAGQPACASDALDRANAIPGVQIGRYEPVPGPCPTLPRTA
jgi:hypothetical protein